MGRNISTNVGLRCRKSTLFSAYRKVLKRIHIETWQAFLGTMLGVISSRLLSQNVMKKGEVSRHDWNSMSGSGSEHISICFVSKGVEEEPVPSGQGFPLCQAHHSPRDRLEKTPRPPTCPWPVLSVSTALVIPSWLSPGSSSGSHPKVHPQPMTNR